MKKIIGGLALATLMGGCIVAPFQPPMGIVSVVKAPLSTEGNFNAGSKSGEASVVSILGIVSTGDCSIDAAVKDGAVCVEMEGSVIAAVCKRKKLDYFTFYYLNCFLPYFINIIYFFSTFFF